MINLKDYRVNWKISIGKCVLLCHHLFGNFKTYMEFKALHFALYFSTFCILWNFLLELFQSKKFLRLVVNFTLYVLLSFSLINFSNELDFDSNLLLYLLSNRAIIMFVHQIIKPLIFHENCSDVLQRFFLWLSQEGSTTYPTYYVDWKYN